MLIELRSGLTLSIAVRGEADGPALVLLPGPMDSWKSFSAVLEHIPSTIRAIAVSPRGRGDSDKPPQGYAVHELASDTVELLDALHIDRAVIAAHSGACFAARRMALGHPDRVAGLVLEATPFTLTANEALHRFKAAVDALTEPVSREFLVEFIRLTLPEGTQTDEIEASVQDHEGVPRHVWQQTFSSLAEYDDTAELWRVAVPVLLLWGGDDDLVPRAEQEELLAAFPDAELIEYSGVGHMVRLEVPARFAADTVAFVERLAGK